MRMSFIGNLHLPGSTATLSPTFSIAQIHLNARYILRGTPNINPMIVRISITGFSTERVNSKSGPACGLQCRLPRSSKTIGRLQRSPAFRSVAKKLRTSMSKPTTSFRHPLGFTTDGGILPDPSHSLSVACIQAVPPKPNNCPI
ncbi:unnamed protein product [Nesidiocoris tenuis]|uniref:Uncharacterized protein n=1 Tax=Nesidiocoris tenuis TaxID=355587 RepID=A0A6H5FX76_9HEMI|nr:unnamed protein product [Nesidiocoris tenuis]